MEEEGGGATGLLNGGGGAIGLAKQAVEFPQVLGIAESLHQESKIQKV